MAILLLRRTIKMVLLIGNYELDQQQSMLRFSRMMLEGLRAAGVEAELIQPAPVFGNLVSVGCFIGKWLAYFDKFVLFPRKLRAQLRKRPALVHICDHSNAMYARRIRETPVVVTCHDLLAVRGGLGEATDTPASRTGKILQHWIVAGLRCATAIACDSIATREDAKKIVTCGRDTPKLSVITLGLNFPYRKLPAEITRAELAKIRGLRAELPYVLHVGSNLRRKNREGVLRIFHRVREKWPGQLVFAGEPLSAELRQQADELGLTSRLLEVRAPSNELLLTLYNGAAAFLFPSRFEGFGWPIAEAQACGAPVLCSAMPPMDEVAGGGAMLRAPEDEEGFAQDLLKLLDTNERARWSAAALENAQRFTAPEMIAKYLELYRTLAPAC